MCFLFGWERACKLFAQVGRHVAGLKQDQRLRNRETAAMAALLDFNDKLDTTYDLVMERLRDVRVYSRRLSPLTGA